MLKAFNGRLFCSCSRLRTVIKARLPDEFGFNGGRLQGVGTPERHGGLLLCDGRQLPRLRGLLPCFRRLLPCVGRLLLGDRQPLLGLVLCLQRMESHLIIITQRCGVLRGLT